ncbi:hypothetical protein LCGC14_2649590 [marine sediment metagenome]|uniref:Uncharacterized protein n=1 Tax=marine sediment metagenome TaxID=412755 RepID=A0A0F8ZV66_9ZZZZ
MYTPAINRTLLDPCASNWLTSAIRSIIDRDPVDAANDAEHLYILMRDRADDVARKLKESSSSGPGDEPMTERTST